MTDKKLLAQMSQFSIIRETPGDNKSQPFQSSTTHKKHQQKPSELKFKIEPIGVQPEDDDDLETCPSRTRSNWPHQINPWWKPTDRFEKPPYSYATLIAHAILTSKDGRLTLSDIYKWISETYPYYKLGQKGWQNSIRHNLSLNKKWFIKVDRRPTQAHPGKGGYWTLQMNMEKVFVDNLCQAGGHSRRHPDMNMYSIYPQHYRSPSSDTISSSSSNSDTTTETLSESMCPNIHITRPEDFEMKKSKNNNVSVPRMRSVSCQEKKTVEAVTHPQTDGKQLTIRFSPLLETSTSQKRKKSARPLPKKGKKHRYVEPGSSTMEDEDDDSAVDVGSFDQISKKRKSSTTTLDTIAASPCHTIMVPQVTPSDVIDSMPYMLLTQSLDYEAIQAQNLLEGLTQTTTEMKTIDLQSSMLDKTLHFSNQFNVEDLSNPDSKLFMSDLATYNFDQYVDFSSTTYLDQPSNILLEQDNNSGSLDIFWPTTSNDCYMDLNSYAI